MHQIYGMGGQVDLSCCNSSVVCVRSVLYRISAKSAIAEHAIGENHHIDFDQSEMVAMEDRFWTRKIKEALLIKRHSNFNQDTGLALSDIWNPYTRHIRIH